VEQRSLRHPLVNSGRGDAQTGRHGAHGEQTALGPEATPWGSRMPPPFATPAQRAGWKSLCQL
jgi:hypothetical protein